MKCRICHLTTVHPPFDSRIFFKECVTLSQNGYDVFLIAPHTKNEIVEGVNMVSIPLLTGRIKRFFLGNWLVFWKSVRVKAKVYHYHDPELFFTALALRCFGKKIVFDMHEDLPKQVMIKNWIPFYFLKVMISFFVKVMERLSLLFFNAIVVVVPELQNRLGKKKTVLLRNFPTVAVAQKAIPVSKNSLLPVIIYAGGLTGVRGIRELIASLSLMKQDVQLWLAGKWENEIFRSGCMKEEGWKKVSELGIISHDQIYSYIKAADVGICTLHETENVKISLPVKGFEYMACGIPMVMTDTPLWRKTFDGCAIFCNPLMPAEIAFSVDRILADKALSSSMISKAQQKLREEYSWETESVKLIQLYQKLIKN